MDKDFAFYYISRNKLIFYTQFVNDIYYDKDVENFIFLRPRQMTRIENKSPDFPVEILTPEIDTIILNFLFNQKIDNLPPTIKTLEFLDGTIDYNDGPREYSIFDHPVEKLPTSIEKIKFGYSFNQPIGMLPRGIRYLEFGEEFDQSVDNLPPGLKTLIVKTRFNQCLDNLPDGLEELKIIGTVCYEEQRRFCYFGQSLENLPGNLKRFEIYSDDYEHSLLNLPSGLRVLVVDGELFGRVRYPDGLEELGLGHIDEPLEDLPENLKKIRIRKYRFLIDNFPKKLEEITIVNGFRGANYDKFPYLKKLTINERKIIDYNS